LLSAFILQHQLIQKYFLQSKIAFPKRYQTLRAAPEISRAAPETFRAAPETFRAAPETFRAAP
jgi:hypothetical protein